ncbi:uncharacterized protein VP01_6922g1 [Puccinia sorghi]|uniref:Uncharacterized protein n=1 Tax=Puccinia sorghi TaxID=27349 RepID=A0A0L6UE43_9BASI|nr:uncharacterized protein VP01_6922g1 [Puccinia sorghi]
MLQQSSQHKQVLQAASKTAFIMILSESFFQQLFRMSWPCFHNLLHLIKPDPIFYNQSQNAQQDVPIQLAVSTFRLGSNGNGAAFLRLKNLFQVGYGTINLYTTRVIKAIYNMQSQLELCPTQEEQVELSRVMQEEGFPGFKSSPWMAITTMITRRGQASLILPYSISLTLELHIFLSIFQIPTPMPQFNSSTSHSFAGLINLGKKIIATVKFHQIPTSQMVLEMLGRCIVWDGKRDIKKHQKLA